MGSVRKEYLSLVKRTMEEQVYNELRRDYGFPRAVCRSLVDMFKKYWEPYLGTDLNNGQILYRVAPYDVGPGVKVDEMATVTVRLTVYSAEDINYASRSQDELLRQRIVRLTNEAMDQGGLLTQADLSIILGESSRTIVRKIRELKDEGIIVPTRGNRMDIGPGISHKTKIVELYIRGYEFTDIKKRTRHSSESIMRYVKDFSRVVTLHTRGHSLHEIRMITNHSERLVKEYIQLYKNYEGNDEYAEKIEQIKSMYGGKKRNKICEHNSSTTKNPR